MLPPRMLPHLALGFRRAAPRRRNGSSRPRSWRRAAAPAAGWTARSSICRCPNSPTMPRLLPVSSLKLTPSTARLTPRRLVRCVLRSATSSRATRGLPSSGAFCSPGLPRSCRAHLRHGETNVRRAQASSLAVSDQPCARLSRTPLHCVQSSCGCSRSARMPVVASRRVKPPPAGAASLTTFKVGYADGTLRGWSASGARWTLRRCRRVQEEPHSQGRLPSSTSASRVLQAFVTLVLFMIILFVATRAAGDPALLILPADATPEQIQMARERIGTDRPYVEQFAIFVRDMATLNFGRSIVYREPVARPDRRQDHRQPQAALRLAPPHSRHRLSRSASTPPRIGENSPIMSCGWWRRSARPRRASGSGWC